MRLKCKASGLIPRSSRNLGLRLTVQPLVSDSPHLEYKDLCPVTYADEAVGQH